MGRKMVLSEQAMQRMEQGIPEMAGSAFKQAYQHALSSSGKVVEAVGGNLVETSVDGTQRVLKALAKPMSVAPGAKRVLIRRK